MPAGQVVVAAKDGPGFDRVETPDKGLGNVEKEQGTMPSAKRHPAIEKAVTTDVGGQTSNSDPYKTLHAGEIQATVERAKAILMKNKNIEEEEAYRYLRSQAMMKRVPIGVIASAIIDAKEMLT